MTAGVSDLTEKEKQALRLLGQGHDAKSIARHLNLSVHTINERLRDARRKLATSSSREAARLLREREGPEFLGDRDLGADAGAAPAQSRLHQPDERKVRRPWLIGGFAMSIVLAALALSLAAPDAAPPQSTTPPNAAIAAADAPAVNAARDFLALIDADDWDASWAATGEAMHTRNTSAVWTSVSKEMRVNLGKPGKRELVSVDFAPAPPNGYTVVKFRTDYARKPGAIETLSMTREGGQWRVAGIMID